MGVLTEIELIGIGSGAEEWQQVKLGQAQARELGMDLLLRPTPVDFRFIEAEVVHAPIARVGIELAHVRDNHHHQRRARLGGRPLDPAPKALPAGTT